MFFNVLDCKVEKNWVWESLFRTKKKKKNFKFYIVCNDTKNVINKFY